MKGIIALKRMLALCLCLMIISGLSAEVFADEEPSGTTADGLPEPGPRTHQVAGDLVHSNSKFELYYDEVGADVYVREKSSGKVWSNDVDPVYYPYENREEANGLAGRLTELVSLNIIDEAGKQENVQISKSGLSGIELKTSKISNGFSLNIKLTKYSITLSINFILDETGFTMSLLKDSLMETGAYKLAKIDFMPAFGASRGDEDGYIFYPDGSGALMRFIGRDLASNALQTFQFYNVLNALGGAEGEISFSRIRDNENYGIHDLGLPVFGIKCGDQAFLGEVIEGAAQGALYVAPGGFRFANLYRTYPSFIYRTTTKVSINREEQTLNVPADYGVNSTVKYYLLSGDQADYSGMANALRNSLVEERGILTKRVKEGLPLALDFFMGVNEPGMIFTNYVPMTKFDEVKNILEELRNPSDSSVGAITNIQTQLLGWNSGGYDQYPTKTTADIRLGGASGLNALTSYAGEHGIDIYLSRNIYIGSKSGSGFNRKNDVIRAYMGAITTNSDRELFFINPKVYLEKYFQKALASLQKISGAHIAYERAGQFTSYDYNKERLSGLQEYADASAEMIRDTKAQTGKVAVQGNNSYVLPYADKIIDMPDSDSGYFFTSDSIPFYQMVIHGYIDYTSSPGNLFFDYDMQVLRWIEYGCNPYYLLTEQNPNLLMDTSYNYLFSSQISLWKDSVIETYNDMNGRLGAIWNEQMVRHEILASGVVCITYSGGDKVYLNYNEKDVTVENQIIPSKDYVVVKEGR